MSAQQNAMVESLDALANEMGKRIARVIVAATMDQLFRTSAASGGQLSLTHEINDPAAVLRGETGAGRKRLRRSGQDVDKGVAAIVAALLTSGGRMDASQLREATGMDRAALLLPLKKALSSGQVKMQGQRRGASYSLPDKQAETSERIPAKEFVAKGVVRRRKSK